MTWDDQPQDAEQHDDETPFTDETPGGTPTELDVSAADDALVAAREAEVAAEPAAEPERSFEDLTLSEAVGEFWRAPLATLRAIAVVAQTPKYMPRHEAQAPSVFAAPAYVPPPLPKAPAAPSAAAG